MTSLNWLNLLTAQVEQAWSFTTVYGEIRRFTCDRITIVYLHVVYGEIRRYTDKKTVVYCLRKRRPYTISVLSRFSPYTIVSLRIRLRRHTIVIRSHVLRQNTVVYDRIFSVYGRIPPFTTVVTFDLGIRFFCEHTYIRTVAIWNQKFCYSFQIL